MEKNNAFISTLRVIVSTITSEKVNQSSLPEEYKNLINTFVSDASNECTSSNQ